MTAKRFYDWQTAGGTDDVMRLVNCLEHADIPWCAIGGVAVNHWAKEPMVTQDVDFVVATESVETAVALLEAEGFIATRFEWSVNFKGSSKVSLQLSTEAFYLLSKLKHPAPPGRIVPHATAPSAIPCRVRRILRRRTGRRGDLSGAVRVLPWGTG